jgi:hypothetical protein
MSEDHEEQNKAQLQRQESPSLTTADDIRSRLQELASQEPGLSQAAQKMSDSTVPELLVEVLDYLTNTPPTAGLDQVGRSFMGGFLMQVKTLEPMEPRIRLRKVGEDSLELSVRQTVYGRSFRNDRLVLFIAGGERSIAIQVSESGDIRLNNRPVAESAEWENELRQRVQGELKKM